MLFSAGGEFCLERLVLREKLLEVDRHVVVDHRFGLLIQQRRIKLMLLIILRIAISHEIKEIKQIFDAEFRLIAGDFFTRMSGGVAEDANELHPLIDIPTDDIPKILVLHQAHQPIIIRHNKGTIHGIHPFDGKLHRPAAIDNRRSRIDMQYFLRRNRHIRKGRKLRVSGQEIEVGHCSFSSMRN